ncbi:hypothetical protein GCM10010991_22520 [Gemmobacter aquaticus]|uniref:Uncharacterized protein n=1 Tax=Gemmobacter aquaticus TaxID=490185 RepID=A0A918DE21_9RHOB|nr:hypothetical protein GCM10010991_22520 [Gemmobacter aquaticus]
MQEWRAPTPTGPPIHPRCTPCTMRVLKKAPGVLPMDLFYSATRPKAKAKHAAFESHWQE